MAFRVAGTTSHVIGSRFNGGFGSGARGHTVFAWLRRSSAATDSPRVGLVSVGASRSIININASTSIRGIVTDGANATTLVNGPAPPGAGVWAPVGLTVRDTGTSRRLTIAHSAGFSVATSALNIAEGALDTVVIGRERVASPAFLGDYAHLALWDVALDEAELAALVRGANPLRIRPGSLAAYFPLDNDFRNLGNPAFALSPNSAAPIWLDQPAGVQPPPRRLPLAVLAAATAAPSGIAGAASGSIGLGGSAAGVVRVAGAASGGIGLGGSAAGAVRVAGAASGGLGLDGSAAGVVRVAGAASGGLGLGGDAAGTVQTPGAGPVTGTAAGGLALAGAADGALRMPLREAAFAALAARLEAALPGVPVERDRIAPVGPEDALPRIVLRDAGHAVAADAEPGMVAYRVAAVVEAHVGAADAAALQVAAGAAHAAILAAVTDVEIPLGHGGQSIWPEDDGMAPDYLPAADSAAPLAVLSVGLRFDLAWPLLRGPYA